MPIVDVVIDRRRLLKGFVIAGPTLGSPTDIDKDMAGTICGYGTCFRIRTAIKQFAAGKCAAGGQAPPTANSVYSAKYSHQG